MPSDEHQTSSESRPPNRNRNYSLYFFEKYGDKYYFRFTRLGVLVLLLLIIIPVIAMLLMFTWKPEQPNVNTNIIVPPATPYSNKPIIRPPSPQSPPPSIKQPKQSMPVSPLPQRPSNNANNQVAPKQTPQSTPAESPP